MAMNNTLDNGSTESRDDELRRTILDFIQIYVGNDPLEPYLRCIKWLKEMTPPGSVQAVLQEVLELAAKSFVQDKRYNSDLRYLKVWIQYADCCVDRGGIFPYLEANGIGLEHGLFYEAYAMLLESSRDYSKADYVFQVGISRGAQPLDRVLLMYNNFRNRMVARQRRKQRQDQEQKAMLARLSGGAQQPLADMHGMEGLPMLPSFQNSTREDPLPDMQLGAGNFGDPAPVCIGAMIYEGSQEKPGSSFEEERMRRWMQSKQLERVAQTRANQVQHQSSSIPYKLPGQREENGYAAAHTSGGEEVAVRPSASLPSSQGMAQTEVLDDVTLVTKAVTDDIMAMFGDEYEKAAAEQSNDDVTTAVDDDIMAMFGDTAPRNVSYAKEKVLYSNVNQSMSQPSGSSFVERSEVLHTNRSQPNGSSFVERSEVLHTNRPQPNGNSFVERSEVLHTNRPQPNGSSFVELSEVLHTNRPQPNGSSFVERSEVLHTKSEVLHTNRPQPNGSSFVERSEVLHTKSEVLDDVTINTKLATDDIMAMFSSELTVGPQRVQNSSVVFHNSPSTSIPSDSESRTLNASNSTLQVPQKSVQLHTTTTKREVVSVRTDGSSSSMSAAVEKVGQWATKEARSSVIDGKSKEDEVVGAVKSRKRSSWSTSEKDTICISDEEEKIMKKQRTTRITSSTEVIESVGTPVVNRAGLKSLQQHPAEYSPALSSVFSKSNGDLQRNILEPTLSRTEHSKPGGQIYPWDQELISNVLKDLSPPLSKYQGYIQSTKKYSGKVSLASLASSKSGVKNKPLELGSSKYQLKASTGHGAFAQVYLAEALKNTGESRRVVLKVQKPPCPWEFYIYRQLDMRIPTEERCSYGSAQNIHIYADCSFMECDFGPYGTLQDVINSYLSKGQRMDEPLCIFYTIEMLHMLESLHKVNLIHGDFKPDNLLIRSSSETLGTWSPAKPGAWMQQGVCLIDWGRSIDISLFAEGTEFVGDSKTDGFRCTEMIEKKPWTFQVDTYGLCGVAHCLLHGNYMEIQKHKEPSGVINRPKAPYKRYWNVSLWQNFFETLLNLNTGTSYETLNKLRRSFESYLRSDPGLTKKLRDLLVKQNTMLLSRK